MVIMSDAASRGIAESIAEEEKYSLMREVVGFIRQPSRRKARLLKGKLILRGRGDEGDLAQGFQDYIGGNLPEEKMVKLAREEAGKVYASGWPTHHPTPELGQALVDFVLRAQLAEERRATSPHKSL